jgi:hypothetical protein
LSYDPRFIISIYHNLISIIKSKAFALSNWKCNFLSPAEASKRKLPTYVTQVISLL